MSNLRGGIVALRRANLRSVGQIDKQPLEELRRALTEAVATESESTLRVLAATYDSHRARIAELREVAATGSRPLTWGEFDELVEPGIEEYERTGASYSVAEVREMIRRDFG